LPLNTWSSQYGNTVINVDDFRPPTFHMNYSTVTTMLRGVALFASQHGYVQMQVEVFDKVVGLLGIGTVGEIIPSGELERPTISLRSED